MPLPLEALDELDPPVELELVEVAPLIVPFGAELHALAATTKPSPRSDRNAITRR
jgi:hypothetical protein